MNNTIPINTSELPIVMQPSILHKIRDYFEDKKPDDAADTFYLYSWLYETSRYQKNSQVWANDVFLKKKLRIGGDKLKRIKAVLRKMDLIDYIPKRHKESGEKRYYIFVRLTWGYDPIIELGLACQLNKSKSFLISRYGELKSICSADDIGLDGLSLDGEDVEIYESDIYFHKGLIKIQADTSNGQREFSFPTHMVPDIIRKTYNYVVEQIN